MGHYYFEKTTNIDIFRLKQFHNVSPNDFIMKPGYSVTEQKYRL